MRSSSIKPGPVATDGCLCGAVRFDIHNALMDVINCHCSKCRRFNGHVGDYYSILDELMQHEERFARADTQDA